MKLKYQVFGALLVAAALPLAAQAQNETSGDDARPMTQRLCDRNATNCGDMQARHEHCQKYPADCAGVQGLEKGADGSATLSERQRLRTEAAASRTSHHHHHHRHHKAEATATGHHHHRTPAQAQPTSLTQPVVPPMLPGAMVTTPAPVQAPVVVDDYAQRREMWRREQAEQAARNAAGRDRACDINPKGCVRP